MQKYKYKQKHKCKQTLHYLRSNQIYRYSDSPTKSQFQYANTNVNSFNNNNNNNNNRSNNNSKVISTSVDVNSYCKDKKERNKNDKCILNVNHNREIKASNYYSKGRLKIFINNAIKASANTNIGNEVYDAINKYQNLNLKRSYSCDSPPKTTSPNSFSPSTPKYQTLSSRNQPAQNNTKNNKNNNKNNKNNSNDDYLNFEVEILKLKQEMAFQNELVMKQKDQHFPKIKIRKKKFKTPLKTKESQAYCPWEIEEQCEHPSPQSNQDAFVFYKEMYCNQGQLQLRQQSAVQQTHHHPNIQQHQHLVCQ